MLSTAAFNALLKTLEEPPSHVIFIFATTEIRKVPVTILSRCQRFDLKKVAPEVLSGHLKNIAEKERAQVDDAALALLARAADGSVRDSLSLLDRAIALGTGGAVTEPLVKDMLGLSDHRAVFDLWAMAIVGNTQGALTKADAMRRDGADPQRLAMDLCDLTHRACRVKVNAAQGDDQSMMGEIVNGLSLAGLNRAWSLCLQGVKDIAQAPDPAAAFDVTLIRLAYASNLPDPGKLIKELYKENSGASPAPSFTPPPSPPEGSMVQRVSNGAPVMTHVAANVPQLHSLEDVVALAQAHNEPRLAGEIRHAMRLVSIKPGVLEVGLEAHMPQEFTTRLTRFLNHATGQKWLISINNEQPSQTLAQKEATVLALKKKEVMDNTTVRDILTLFPGAEVINILNKEND